MDQFKQRFKNYLEVQNVEVSDLKGLHDVYKTWLYLEGGDTEFIDVGLAALIDRELPGDPVWVFLIAPSGALKTELIRSFSAYPKSYSLDTLTPHTLISGKAEKNKNTGEYEPIAGIMQDLNGKTLLIKDFTTVLSSSEDTRTEIYGQLRSAYDGYLEKGFGTMRHPVRVRASFGLMAGVTPIIDKYTRMAGLLGERFLMVRQSPNKIEAARKAAENTNVETFMRIALQSAVKSFLEKLDLSEIPTITEAQQEDIIHIGAYVGLMRCGVWANYYQGEIIDMDVVEPEVPTRVSKQLKKLAQLLAIIRGRKAVGPEEMATIRRVARDTADPKRQRIVDAYYSHGLDLYLDVNDITGLTNGLYYRTIQNQLKIMEVLDIVETNDAGHYGFTPFFRKYLDVLYSDPLVSSEKKPENGLFFEGTPGSVYKTEAGERMAQVAIKHLEREGGEMGRRLFFNVMYERKYHDTEVLAVLGVDPRFEFTGDVVRLREAP